MGRNSWRCRRGFVSEAFFQHLRAKRENLLQAWADNQARKAITKRAEPNRIMKQVPHLDAARNFPKVVFVVPDSIWAHALFIDEVPLMLNVCDLGHPFQRDVQQRAHTVGDEEARVHLGGQRRPDFESE